MTGKEDLPKIHYNWCSLGGRTTGSIDNRNGSKFILEPSSSFSKIQYKASDYITKTQKVLSRPPIRPKPENKTWNKFPPLDPNLATTFQVESKCNIDNCKDYAVSKYESRNRSKLSFTRKNRDASTGLTNDPDIKQKKIHRQDSLFKKLDDDLNK